MSTTVNSPVSGYFLFPWAQWEWSRHVWTAKLSLHPRQGGCMQISWWENCGVVILWRMKTSISCSDCVFRDYLDFFAANLTKCSDDRPSQGEPAALCCSGGFPFANETLLLCICQPREGWIFLRIWLYMLMYFTSVARDGLGEVRVGLMVGWERGRAAEGSRVSLGITAAVPGSQFRLGWTNGHPARGSQRRIEQHFN